VIVLEPVARNADPDQADFGAGCGRWLHLFVSGQNAFDKTPTWESVGRVAQEMGRPNARLTVDQATALAGRLGATAIAVGTIAGSPHSGKLTYQIWRVADHRPLGKALTLSGTQEQIVADLPGLARRMAASLGVKTPSLPAKVDVEPASFALLGRLPWVTTPALPAADQQALSQLADRSPLAALLLLRSFGTINEGRQMATANAILTRYADNPLICAAVGGSAFATSDDNNFILRAVQDHRTAIVRQAAQHPGNYLWAHLSLWAARGAKDVPAENAAAIATVQNGFRNPDAWLAYGATLGNAGESVRHSRFTSAMTQTEQQAVVALYPEWLRAVAQAARLDPQYGKAWYRVATAATFAGETALADAALQAALKYDPDKGRVYDWGLQMYQPKWGGSPAMLHKMAQMALAERYTTSDQALSAVDGLKDAGFTAEAGQLLTRVIAEAAERERRSPDDPEPKVDRIRALIYEGRTLNPNPGSLQQAVALGHEIVRRWPKDTTAHLMLATALDDGHAYNEEAAQEYGKMIECDPTDPEAHYEMAIMLKHKGDIDAANREFQEVARLAPTWAEPHYGLAQGLMERDRVADAIVEYRKAVTADPGFFAAFLALCNAYTTLQRYPEAIEAGVQAVRLDPLDSEARIALGAAYGFGGKPQESATQNRAALKIDPNSPIAHENLGDALIELGQKQEARSEWETVLRLYPNDRAAAEARQMLDQNP
jgi:tetratricopeptide (TPR) repeat protein